MRLFNLVIMCLYGFNLAIDVFSQTGSLFFRYVMLTFAWADFLIFNYVVITKLSTFLNFPVFGLPSNLMVSSSDGQQIPNNGDTGRGQFPDTKLESSMENTFENSPEPKDIENQTESYPKDLEFDDEEPETPELAEEPVDEPLPIQPVSGFDDAQGDEGSDEEKEGDVSYHNDFELDDEI